MLLRALTIVVMIICMVVLGLLIVMAGRNGACGSSMDNVEMLGGAVRKVGIKTRKSPRRASPHIVVDTLNAAHWLHHSKDSKMTHLLRLETIIATIDETAPVLKRKYVGRVMYVVKDRDSVFNDEAARQAYDAAAKRNGVYISVVERYAEPPIGTAPSSEHSAQGRDDFYLALLAQRWKCAVLTEDRLKDFDRFRATIPPFHVYEYAFWREFPYRESIRPDSAAYARLKKPVRVGYVGVLDSLADTSVEATLDVGS